MSTENATEKYCECCGDLAGTIVCGTCHDYGIQSRDKSIDKLEKELSERDDVEAELTKELTKERSAAEDARDSMVEDLRALITWGLKAGADPIDARVLVSSQEAHDLLYAAPLPDMPRLPASLPQKEYQKQREADAKAFDSVPTVTLVIHEPRTGVVETKTFNSPADAGLESHHQCEHCRLVNRVVRFPTAKALKQHHKDAHLPTGRKRAVRVKHFINSLEATAAACGKTRAKGMSVTQDVDATTCQACLDA